MGDALALAQMKADASPAPAHGKRAGRPTRRRRGAIARRQWPWRGGELGTSALELAIAVPVLLLLIFGTLDFGWLVLLSNMTGEAAREGARAAKVIVTPVAASPPVLVTGPQAAAIAAAARRQVMGYGSSTYDVVARAGGEAPDRYYVEVTVTTTWQPVVAGYFGAYARQVGATSRLYLP
jgi:Flp pilus assembly protein TadG